MGEHFDRVIVAKRINIVTRIVTKLDQTEILGATHRFGRKYTESPLMGVSARRELHVLAAWIRGASYDTYHHHVALRNFRGKSKYAYTGFVLAKRAHVADLGMNQLHDW